MQTSLEAPGTKGKTDEALMSAVARGDERALATLYDRHAAVAYGIAVRVLRDPSLAEEALQEGFLALWRGAARYDSSRAAVGTWIVTLVHRRAVDLVRSHARRPVEQLTEEVETSSPGVEEIVSSRRDAARVRRAVVALPRPEREVIELAYFVGLTQREIAERLGTPLGTVKSRTFSGLTRLRLLLDGERPVPAIRRRQLAAVPA
jgi:RNA polymerase sigma-70 factor, ECF subfamily